MPDIVITEFMDTEAVESLKKDFHVIYDETLVDRAEEMLTLAADCRALIVRNRTQVRGILLEKAQKMTAVGRLGVGLDNIDLKACAAKNIAVIPATGANDISVAEYVIAGLLMMARGCYCDSAEVASGAWPRARQIGGEVYEKTLGLIGFGNIAREVAARAKALGMNLIACDPFVPDNAPCWERYAVRKVALEELLGMADAISLHIPLTPETKHLLNAERIGQMRDGAWVVNASRGGTVDETALVAGLHSGKIGGAVLDVYENEPLPANSVLANAPRCILTAHIGGVTRESNTRVSALIAQKIREALSRQV